jgi:hypothetical protein
MQCAHNKNIALAGLDLKSGVQQCRGFFELLGARAPLPAIYIIAASRLMLYFRLCVACLPLCDSRRPSENRESVFLWLCLIHACGAGRKSAFMGWILAGLLPGKHRNRASGRPKAGWRADFGAFPVAVWPKSGPDLFTARKHYHPRSTGCFCRVQLVAVLQAFGRAGCRAARAGHRNYQF